MSTRPHIARVDLDDLGLDEIVAHGADIHVERMSPGNAPVVAGASNP